MTHESADLVVFVPAYQVGKQLDQTLLRLPTSIWERLLALYLMDDGSTDATEEICKRWATQNPLVHHWRWYPNRGYGAVVLQGLDLALNHAPRWIACLHGDGQYAPEFLPALIQQAQTNNFAVVQGSRLAAGKGALRGGMPFYKWVAGHLLVFCENRILRLGLSDYHSGYLLYAREFVEACPRTRLQGTFEIDLEILACARSMNFSVGEVEIPTHYGDEVSHLRPIHYGISVLLVLWRYLRGYYRP